jgi:hypothetical protein
LGLLMGLFFRRFGPENDPNQHLLAYDGSAGRHTCALSLFSLLSRHKSKPTRTLRSETQGLFVPPAFLFDGERGGTVTLGHLQATLAYLFLSVLHSRAPGDRDGRRAFSSTCGSPCWGPDRPPCPTKGMLRSGEVVGVGPLQPVFGSTPLPYRGLRVGAHGYRRHKSECVALESVAASDGPTRRRGLGRLRS